MKKSLLAMLFAFALVVPAVAENMWVSGFVGFNYDKDSTTDLSCNSFSIAPEFGYSLNDTWDIGIDIGYVSEESPMWDPILGKDVKETESGFEVAPFARYKMFSIGDFSFIAKGSVFYKNSKHDKADYKTTGYGIEIAPVVSYSINERWSIDGVLNFASIGFSHEKDDMTGDPERDHFGFNVNNGDLFSIGFSYHF